MFKLIEKNLKILFRSKFSFFVVILGPILLILLAGLAFNNSAEYNIKIGTFSTDYSETSKVFINNLDKEFSVVNFDSEDNCINALKSKGFHSCIVIPAGLSLDDNDLEQIDFYIDNTRVNIASYIEQTIYRSIKNSSTILSKNLAENLVDTIKITRDETLKNQKKTESEKIHLEEISLKLKKSKDKLQNTNLDFDEKAMNTDKLKKEIELSKTEFSTIKSLTDKSIKDFESSVDDIEDLNITNNNLDKEISNAKTKISSLKTSYNDINSNSSNFNNLLELTNSFSSEIENVQSKFETARSNKNTILSELDNSVLELKKTNDKLNEFKLSFSKVESSINSNKVLNAENIAKPVNIQTHKIVSGSKLNHFFPSLIILVLMFVTLIMSASQVTQDRLNRANLRVSMTPVNYSKQLAATFFSIMIVVLFQISLIILTVWFIFDIDIKTSFVSISEILLTMTIFFTLLGIALGNIFRTEQATILGSATIASMFFIISDLILPIESMPQYMIDIVSKTPFVLSTDLLRKVIFFGTDLGTEFKILLTYAIGICLILISVNIINHIIKKLKTKYKYKNS